MALFEPIVVKTGKELDNHFTALTYRGEDAEYDEGYGEWYEQEWNCIIKYWYNEDYDEVFCETLYILEGTSEGD